MGFSWSYGKSFAISVVWWLYGKSPAVSVPRLVLRSISRVFRGLVVLGKISRVFRLSAGPAVNLSCCLVIWWSYGKSHAFSVVWRSYGKSLAVSVVVRWLPVAPRWFNPAPRALLRLSGGPTATLSRFLCSGGPTLNLSRFPSLGWSCVQSLVFL